MKEIYTILIIFSSLISSGQSFQIAVSQNAISMSPNQTHQLSISVTPSGGFNQQIFLSSNCISTNCNGVTLSFSPNPVIYPYANLNVNITVTGFALNNIYDFVITGVNGPVSDTCILHVDVSPVNCFFTQLHYQFMYYFNSILATSDGVWIGGNGLENYGAGIIYNPAGQFSGICRDIAADPSGNLWLATSNGIQKYDGTFWSDYNTSNSSLTTNLFTSIAVDTSGIVWTTSYNQGLFKFDGLAWTHYDTSNTNFPTDELNDITFDRNGLLWVSAKLPAPTYANVVYRYDGVNWTQVNFPSCLNLQAISQAYFDSQNNAWFSNSNDMPERPTPFGYGLVKYDGISVEIWSDSLLSGVNHCKYDTACNILLQDSASKIQGPGVFSLFVDHYDRVWGGVSESDNGEGIFVLDAGSFTNYNSGNSQLAYPGVGNFSEHGDTIYFINDLGIIGGFARLTAFVCGISTSVPTDETKDIFEVYPNPSPGEFFVKCYGEVNHGLLKIRDISGKIVCIRNANETMNLILPAGFYFCTYDNGVQSITKKLIVQGEKF